MTKILDWSLTGYLTAAIESSIHLWSGRTQSVCYTINTDNLTETDNSIRTTITCLKWDSRGEKLGFSFTVLRSVESGSLSDDTVTDTDSQPNTSADSNTDNYNTVDGSPSAPRVFPHTDRAIIGHDGRPNHNFDGFDTIDESDHTLMGTPSEATLKLPNTKKTMYIKVFLNGVDNIDY